jgi:glycosyltransferase involved in cell wall biosynthesis
MKVAIIHYWLITRRGGEKVVESILKVYPEADIYTLFLDQETYGDNLPKNRIYTSILNNGFLRKHYQKMFPLYPFGIRSLKLKDKYDLIISSESGPAKGIQIKDNTPHLCYIHSPMRYCWGFTDEYLRSMPKAARPLAKFFFKRLRNWDKTTIGNVTHYIANSQNVAQRVERYYGEKASVLYPPIDLGLFEKPLKTDAHKDIYLSFGAITPYKRIDLLVDAFNENGKPLVVIGAGSEKEKLLKKARPNIKFMGSLAWEEIETFLYRTKALLFPGEEDFGMIPLEVMAYGIPVLAYKKGGALETIVESDEIEKSSGLFFKEQTVESVQDCIDKFEEVEDRFDPNWIRSHARKFGEDVFIEKFKAKAAEFYD